MSQLTHSWYRHLRTTGTDNDTHFALKLARTPMDRFEWDAPGQARERSGQAIAVETIATERPLLVPLPTYHLLEPHLAFAELATAAA